MEESSAGRPGGRPAAASYQARSLHAGRRPRGEHPGRVASTQAASLAGRRRERGVLPGELTHAQLLGVGPGRIANLVESSVITKPRAWLKQTSI